VLTPKWMNIPYPRSISNCWVLFGLFDGVIGCADEFPQSSKARIVIKKKDFIRMWL